jgi:hypothetical protein
MADSIGIPQTYLTSTKNLNAIFDAITKARAPRKFTIQFLQELGFKSTSDRIVVNLLKALNFLNEVGEPQEPYFNYLDTTQSKKVLAKTIQKNYEALFRVRRDAYKLSYEETKEKLKVITQGAHSNDVIGKMARTFTELCKMADFSSEPSIDGNIEKKEELSTKMKQTVTNDKETTADPPLGQPEPLAASHRSMKIDGLVYNINIVLPETRDTKVYEAIFSSLKNHLLYE